jgi:hypothetical protein
MIRAYAHKSKICGNTYPFGGTSREGLGTPRDARAARPQAERSNSTNAGHAEVRLSVLVNCIPREQQAIQSAIDVATSIVQEFNIHGRRS